MFRIKKQEKTNVNCYTKKISKRVCQKCGKGIMRGNKVSHAKNRSKKISKPNLHWKRIKIDGQKKRMLLCAKCIKKLKKDTTKAS